MFRGVRWVSFASVLDSANEGVEGWMQSEDFGAVPTDGALAVAESVRYLFLTALKLLHIFFVAESSWEHSFQA